MTLTFGLRAIGITAPGLENWEAAQPILATLPPHRPQLEDYRYTPPAQLPRNERRRATRITRLAFAACADALRDCDPGYAADLRTVFASSSGDMDTLDGICRALAPTGEEPHREIALSPLQFHNSVHNATAGYWSIAGAAKRASTSISAYDGTFAAGLLEAATQLADEPDSPVLLVCYDIPPPQPLQQGRPVQNPFAVALLLDKPDNTQWQLTLSPTTAGESTLVPADWEQLRRDNAAARSLPLLHQLATSKGGTLVLPGPSSALQLHCAPPPS